MSKVIDILSKIVGFFLIFLGACGVVLNPIGGVPALIVGLFIFPDTRAILMNIRFEKSSFKLQGFKGADWLLFFMSAIVLFLGLMGLLSSLLGGDASVFGAIWLILTAFFISPVNKLMEGNPKAGFAAASVLLGVLLTANLSNSAVPEERPEKQKKSASPRIDNFRAYYETQIEVKKLLKSPTTAKFPSMDEISIGKSKPNVFHISGFVDAQNGFGAMIRSNYICTAEFDVKKNTREIHCNILE